MDETVPLVKANSSFVDGVGDDSAHARDFRCGEAPPQRVRQERRPQASAAPLRIYRKAADQQQWDLIRQAAPQLGRRQRNTLFHGRRDGEITNDAIQLRYTANNVGPGRKSFARSRSHMSRDVCTPLENRETSCRTPSGSGALNCGAAAVTPATAAFGSTAHEFWRIFWAVR